MRKKENTKENRQFSRSSCHQSPEIRKKELYHAKDGFILSSFDRVVVVWGGGDAVSYIAVRLWERTVHIIISGRQQQLEQQ